MQIVYNKYFSTQLPELEEISKWTVFTRFNLSTPLHLFSIRDRDEIVAYALITEHSTGGVPVLESRVQVPGFQYLLDYLEVRLSHRKCGLATELLSKISREFRGEPIVLETMPDTTAFFLKLGAKYIREPVENAVNVMVLNLKSIDELSRDTRKRFYKWNKLT